MAVLGFGDVKVTTIWASRFGLDGGAMFGVVPKALWARKLPPDERNRIPMVTRVLLVEAGDRRVLVDAGFGSRWSAKERDIYALEDLNLLSRLESLGCRPEDITDVVVTHLHFDHASGLVREGGDGLVPTFSKATYHVQRVHWEWAQAPTPKDAGSFRREELDALGRHAHLNLVEGVYEVVPGVKLWPVSGHSRGMQLVLLGRGDERGLYCTDLVPTRWHLRPAWNMAYDNEPLRTLEEKRFVLRQALRRGWVLLFEHDPEVAAVRPTDAEGGFEVLVEDSV